MDGPNRPLTHLNRSVAEAAGPILKALGFAHLDADLMLERGPSVRHFSGSKPYGAVSGKARPRHGRSGMGAAAPRGRGGCASRAGACHFHLLDHPAPRRP